MIDDPLAEVAKSIRVPAEVMRAREECVDPWFHRIVRALWRGGFVGAVACTEDDIAISLISRRARTTGIAGSTASAFRK